MNQRISFAAAAAIVASGFVGLTAVAGVGPFAAGWHLTYDCDGISNGDDAPFWYGNDGMIPGRSSIPWPSDTVTGYWSWERTGSEIFDHGTATRPENCEGTTSTSTSTPPTSTTTPSTSSIPASTVAPPSSVPDNSSPPSSAPTSNPSSSTAPTVSQPTPPSTPGSTIPPAKDVDEQQPPSSNTTVPVLPETK